MDNPFGFYLPIVFVAVVATWMWVQRRIVRRYLIDAGLWPVLPRAPGFESTPLVPPGGLDRWLLIVSAIVFAATRFVSLESFPIYFFTDEAANTVLAAEFVRDGFQDGAGRFFPTYFANSEKLSLSLSVYLQVVPTLLFGRSIFVTRATAALVALSGTMAVGLMLKNVFRIRSAWLGVMLLTITPAWFLHTRTAFETSLYVAMYSWFLYFYLRYRQGHAAGLLLAVAFGALAFYSYNAGQPGLLLSAVLLAAVDWRFHWHQRKAAVVALALAIVLAMPQVRFQVEHPGEVEYRLRLLDSYVVRPGLTTSEKVAQFFKEYTLGLNPVYWYAPDNGQDLIRHRMKDYGNILWPTLPLAAWGLIMSLRRRHAPEYRAVLIAAFTAPAGAALSDLLVTRVLVFVLPMAILSAIGGAELLQRLSGRLRPAGVSTAAFLLLTVASGWMLRDAVVNGPNWYSDYGRGGMQYGAQEVLREAVALRQERPETQVWVFATWLDGADMLRRFFAPDDRGILMLSLDSFLSERFEAVEGAVLVLTEEDHRRILGTGKLADERVDRIVPLPDGRPGFYFVEMRYSKGADAIFLAEAEKRRQLVEELILLGGRKVQVGHTPFDAGTLSDLFDNNPDTFARTAGLNPARLDLVFGEPVEIVGIRLTTSPSDVSLRIQAFSRRTAEADLSVWTYSAELRGPILDSTLMPPPGMVERIVIEVESIHGLPSESIYLHDFGWTER